MSKKEISLQDSVIGFALLAAGFAVRVYALADCWLWFAATPFGLPVITPLQAWGLLITKGLVMMRLDKTIKRDDAPITDGLGLVIGALIVWGCAYVVHAFTVMP